MRQMQLRCSAEEYTVEKENAKYKKLYWRFLFSFFYLLDQFQTRVLPFLQVLCQMASMRMEDLLGSLFESMSMTNISGCKTGECRGKSVLEGSEDGFVEAILLDAMEKMEGLVLEGLRIQMESSSKAINIKERKGKVRSRHCLVLLMLIQVRDPMEGNGAVGEFMIGLIEASAAEVSARRFHIHGVHIAGIKRMRRTNGKDFIWSASAERCKGTCNSCCWQHGRNPEIVFAHES